jgi:hypothetical protein
MFLHEALEGALKVLSVQLLLDDVACWPQSSARESLQRPDRLRVSPMLPDRKRCCETDLQVSQRDQRDVIEVVRICQKLKE